MLYQLLTGVLPFKADSMAQLMFKIANEDAVDVRLVQAGLSEQLANVVAQSLSKVPADRYPDGDAFAAALRSVLLLPGTPDHESAPEISAALLRGTAEPGRAEFAATVVQSSQLTSLKVSHLADTVNNRELDLNTNTNTNTQININTATSLAPGGRRDS